MGSWGPASVKLIFTQTAVAGLVLVPTVLAVFGHTGTYDGALQAIFWMLYACVASFYTITIVLVLGFVVRLSERRLAWWRRHWWIAALGILAGAAGMVLAHDPALTSVQHIELDGIDYDEVVPAWGLLLPSWFVLAYSLVNFFTPAPREG